MRFVADRYNTRGTRLEKQGDMAAAIAAYRRAIRWDAKWSVPWYNLGLLYKRQHNWSESLTHNRTAATLDAGDEAAWWNLGIAATALGEWATAREAWRACGIDVPEGVGPLEMNFGLVPIRINPQADGEVVWSDRIDPARAIIRSVPLPESAHRYGDLLLHDGAPNGTRVRNGQEVPVFDELELLQPSGFGTYVVTIAGMDAEEAERLVDSVMSSDDVAAEDWSNSLRWLCKTCSEGHVDHSHHHGTETGDERRFAFAATAESIVMEHVDEALALSSHASLVRFECALPPEVLQ